MLCSKCEIDEEDAGIHHTTCEGDCDTQVCDSCRLQLIFEEKWIVSKHGNEGWSFDKCSCCYKKEA